MTADPEPTPFESIRPDIDATLQAMESMAHRRACLKRRQRESANVVMHRAAAAYERGELTENDLINLYMRLRDCSPRGWSRSWKNASLPHLEQLRSIVRRGH